MGDAKIADDIVDVLVEIFMAGGGVIGAFASSIVLFAYIEDLFPFSLSLIL